MDLSVSLKDQIWFLRVCHHVSNVLYVSNQTMHNDFEITYVTEVIRINTSKYENRSTVHSNQLIRTLFNPSVNRRLKRLWPEDLAQ